MEWYVYPVFGKHWAVSNAERPTTGTDLNMTTRIAACSYAGDIDNPLQEDACVDVKHHRCSHSKVNIGEVESCSVGDGEIDWAVRKKGQKKANDRRFIQATR